AARCLASPGEQGQLNLQELLWKLFAIKRVIFLKRCTRIGAAPMMKIPCFASMVAWWLRTGPCNGCLISLMHRLIVRRSWRQRHLVTLGWLAHALAGGRI